MRSKVSVFFRFFHIEGEVCELRVPSPRFESMFLLVGFKASELDSRSGGTERNRFRGGVGNMALPQL
jgi:hypothetical protein